ncbi:acetolactate synthase small subunit [Fulvivirgaceae bacterium BMA10]|uniref:Acetolactate synthase small subunit n=1 Tax=Splendidivirga corallicola TaxID=3051826 RepID=A0ABT8KU24_9BACT|nr:acetolactate synthase small subunit [Fulvivirgaceae bacterium BMA10]
MELNDIAKTMDEELMNNHQEEKPLTISVLTENKSGLLNGVTIIFTRRKINIEAINVSITEVEGVSRYTILIRSNRETAEKVVKQIRKLVEVLGAFVYEEDEIHYQELALYKVPMSVFLQGNKIERLVRNSGARILAIERDYIVIEKTGHKNETYDLFEKLKPYGLLEFVRSGRIAVSKSKRETATFLKELEEASKIKSN